MNVLSVFDGIAGAKVALDRLGIPCTYYASEIDKYAIQVAKKNHPDIIQLGDVRDIDVLSLPSIDLLIGGSPCQDLSIAGKQKGLQGERSSLFYEYIWLLSALQPEYFILENVQMKKVWEIVFSIYTGVQPTLIDSALVSGQTRKRLYWTNIPHIIQPEDMHLGFKDVYNQTDKYYYSNEGIRNIKYWSKSIPKTIKYFTPISSEKFPPLEASMYKKYSRQRLWVIEDIYGWRYVTPLECERLQTFPDNYTQGISDTQRYKCLGNSFTVDVIKHILSYME